MFDAPVDAWYVWIGLVLASGAVLGVTTSLPTAPPPNAASLAETVERTAGTEYGATAEHPVDADEIRLRPHGVGLRSDAGTTHATFAFERVTPVEPGTPLHDVLLGAPPPTRFDSRIVFAATCVRARNAGATWERIDGPVVVRHVVWGDVDVTLVGH